MIAITTLKSLPNYCYECPCHDGESGYCQADKEQRFSNYRPFWCPLKEIHDEEANKTMDENEQIEEERFVESLIHLWIQSDAPKWITDYVRQELRRQRGLLEEETEQKTIDCHQVINDLETAKIILCKPEMLSPEMCTKIGQVITSAVNLLKEHEVRELTIDEWREWKNNPKRDPICELWENDISPMWILNPNKVHEPALLMGKLKLFTGKPTFEQCKKVKWG